MKHLPVMMTFASLLTFGGTLLAAPLATGHGSAHQTPSAGDDQARRYPLSTCVVSGDSLVDGDMGPPVDYYHQESGRPDRLVRLCCRGCVREFRQDPAKFLKLLDAAAAKSRPAARR